MKVFKQIGSIEISKDLYENEYQTMILKLFSEFQPLQINLVHFPSPMYKIIGTHKDFGVIQHGGRIPEYEVLCIYGDSISPRFELKPRS